MLSKIPKILFWSTLLSALFDKLRVKVRCTDELTDCRDCTLFPQTTNPGSGSQVTGRPGLSQRVESFLQQI